MVEISMRESKSVFIVMAADPLHHRHVNIISKAGELGEITVGLITDIAISKARQSSSLNYRKREIIVRGLKGVENVIPQEGTDYSYNLNHFKPDYVIYEKYLHEEMSSVQKETVIETLKKWGGELIEIPTEDEELGSQEIEQSATRAGTTPTIRLNSLRRLLDSKNLIRVNEVHNGLSGLITETTRVVRANTEVEFQAMWSSSLTDSTAKGMPDIGAVDITSRVNTVNQIFEVTTKPMLFDGDSGGIIEIFEFTVKSLERLGVSAVVIEDKVGPKRNSLLGNDVSQQQDSIENFRAKITAGKKAQVTKEFMIVARIESLILEAGMQDALARADAYIDAGADIIMIHSRQKSPSEIFEFCEKYQDIKTKVPLMVVPSSFNQVTEEEWEAKGVKIICYANHMLRSAYPAMVDVAKSILLNGRSKDCDDACLPIKDILNLIPGAS